MTNEDKLSAWEEKNSKLVNKINSFCKDYEEKNLKAFKENEYKAHKKMQEISSKTFKKEIDTQLDALLLLHESSLIET